MEFNPRLSRSEIETEMQRIANTYKNIEFFKVDDYKDIYIKFTKNLAVSQIREIEFMWHSITLIDFETNMVKFSKRYDQPKHLY